MTSDRVTVSRALLRNALADAIDWEESFLASHDASMGATHTTAHCGPRTSPPSERCDAYKAAAASLRDYRRVYDRITGPRQPEPGHAVSLAELMSRQPQ